MTMPNKRCQRGQDLVITLSTNRPTDALPVVTVEWPDGTTLPPGRAVLERMAPSPRYYWTFRSPPGSSLGTYRLIFTWAINGIVDEHQERIDLVAGGDSGGNIIALYHYHRPEAAYCLAQLSSGRIVQGRNPRL